MPSLYEGFGLPPLEAMSLGCPVVSSRAGSLPEVCGEAAYYFDPLSDEGLESALRRIVDEPMLRDALRRAGAAQAARYRWAGSANALLDTLRMCQ